MRNWDQLTEDERKFIRFSIWRMGAQAWQHMDAAAKRFDPNREVFKAHWLLAQALLTEMNPNGEGRRNEEGAGTGGEPGQVQGDQAGEDRGQQGAADQQGSGESAGRLGKVDGDAARDGAAPAATAASTD